MDLIFQTVQLIPVQQHLHRLVRWDQLVLLVLLDRWFRFPAIHSGRIFQMDLLDRLLRLDQLNQKLPVDPVDQMVHSAPAPHLLQMGRLDQLKIQWTLQMDRTGRLVPWDRNHPVDQWGRK